MEPYKLKYKNKNYDGVILTVNTKHNGIQKRIVMDLALMDEITPECNIWKKIDNFAPTSLFKMSDDVLIKYLISFGDFFLDKELTITEVLQRNRDYNKKMLSEAVNER